MFPMKWRFPIFCTLLAATFITLADSVFQPMHARGEGQRITSWIDGTSRLAQIPGLWFAERIGLRTEHGKDPLAWAVALAANVPVYLVAAAALQWMFSLRGVENVRDPAAPRIAPSPSRRQLLGRLAAGAGAATLAYAYLNEPWNFCITRRRLFIRDLHPSLNGLTIAQLSDIHHGPWTNITHVRRIVTAANALNADLIALTGDYVYASPQYIAPVMRELAALNAKAGVVAVLGNHDWWEGLIETRRELQRANIPLIDNTRLVLSPDRKLEAGGSEGLCIAGVGDYWMDVLDFGAALGGLPDDMPRLLLSHQPDVAEDSVFRRTGFRVDLMISGHTHGGQIRIPGLGTPVVPSKYGQKYASGLVQGPVCPVFVSRGLGTTIMPLRFGVQPEIAVIELCARE
jgi:predicted MPP superfamily phosphohydrolase